MHILEIPSFFTPYGGEFCLNQAKALQMQGNEVRILSNVQLSFLKTPVSCFLGPVRRWNDNIGGVDCYRSFQRGIPKNIRFNVMRWISIVVSMYNDYKEIYGNPDILHAHCNKWAGYAAMIISEKEHLPYVITEHISRLAFEREFGPAPSDVWQIPLLRRSYEKADMVITVSDELSDDISCYFGKNYRHVTISNTIDTDFFSFRKRQPLSGRPFKLCCLADSDYRKGYDILIPAFKNIKNRNVELHIAGRDTDCRELRKAASGANIFIHGELDKYGVRNLLYSCDALVLASRSEVQPLVILEAMSTGIPVISTTIIPLQLKMSSGCFTVPVNNIEKLSAAIDNLIDRYRDIDLKSIACFSNEISSPQSVGKKINEVFKNTLISI